MKKIYIIIAALAALMACGACTDDLDQKPVIGDTSETVYSTIDGYRSVLAKVYSSYSLIGAERGGGSADISSEQGQDMIRNLFNMQELPTDEAAYKYASGDMLTNISFMQWDVNDVWVSDTYYRLYYIVALSNELLRNCASVPGSFSDSERAEVATYALEARFMRAYTYWWVLDLFGKGPFVDENMPLTGYIPEAYNGSQLYDFIKNEIDQIAPLLPETPSYARAGRAAAYALGARLAINGKVYTGTDHSDEALDYCKKVMALPYSLESDYRLLFNADNDRRTNEIIFAFATDNENSA
ncbi:MAG: RagB/SusD family nutrient uptake outer membrane protein, partial [Muribaculaceae bacterium]|nr:RagB/SusD family nutrient uptake outer membrane protein [Muribaculaceae bacterium]